MKDYREPSPKKFRRISGWNTWQTEWWKGQEGQKARVYSFIFNNLKLDLIYVYIS